MVNTFTKKDGEREFLHDEGTSHLFNINTL